jgi:UDP-N-acetylmuramyl pentapeptide phosphotransferase/UDP-N-acetylglucosamine-1-phosphate transferase
MKINIRIFHLLHGINFSVDYQMTGIMIFHRKILIMAPLHHHFEKKGYNENDIVKAFWIVGLCLATAAVGFGVWI